MSTMSKLMASMVGKLKPDRAQGRASGEALDLPVPNTSGGLGLMDALAARHSTREFSETPLPRQLLSDLLWAAYGINRPAEGGRTAPSALNAQDVDVYAALAGGLYFYHAKEHRLNLIASVDARKVTGFQDFVDAAPLDLIYVADNSHVSVVSGERRAVHSAVCAGAIAENVYLFCAANGLVTVARAWFDEKALAAALRLSADEHVLLAQTVGYPREKPV